jgi:nicotinamide-nucleotide amidase
MIRRAAILSNGDELTTGRTVDTNANFIADKLVGIGVDVVCIFTVGDYPDRMEWAWNEAVRHADVVISSGGLGPTADDLTSETVAKVCGRKLILNEEVADRIRQMFAAMGRQMPENNLKQARFPEGAEIIPNPLGTAPGFRVELSTPDGPRTLIVMPGVPREMKPMLEEQILPWLQAQRDSEDVYLNHVFQTFGISESALDELVAGCVAPEEGRIAFRAAFPQISVRLTVQAPREHAEDRLRELADRLRQRLGDYAYGEGDTTMEAVVGELLVRRGRTVAVAESCTGGLVGHRLTEVAGSSAYVRGGIVAYADDVKLQSLGVRAETLRQHGAVSEQTAAEMAAGVRARLGADLGVAITGIAGPSGGTADKPVGTVCFALDAEDHSYVRRYQLWGTRPWVKLLSSQIALDWMRRYLLGLDPSESGILRR